MHIYRVASGTPVVTILRGRPPKGTEVGTVIKHVTKRLRTHWPNTRIVWRGHSHYGRVETMDWADDNGTDYIFGLPGNWNRMSCHSATANQVRLVVPTTPSRC
jgi:Transposase DDE domain group 1